MNMLMELRAEINDANSVNRALKAEIERLQIEVNLLTISRREIMEIDEEHVAEIERLKAVVKSMGGTP